MCVECVSSEYCLVDIVAHLLFWWQKLNKKSKYNLSDGEEDEFGSQSGFQGRDDFEDEVPIGDEDDVEAAHTESMFLNLC